MTHQISLPDLSLTVGDMLFRHEQIAAALTQVGAAFDKETFDAALRQSYGSRFSARAGGRVLQTLQRKGVIVFDQSAQTWRKVPQAECAASKTLPLPTAAPMLPPPTLPTGPRRMSELRGHAGLALSALACFGLIAALITLNASFAWELGREAQQFRWSFVVGLMALDMMRPLLVAAGFSFAAQKRGVVAATAFVIGFSLSPVSILSSTAILSSSVLLGAEMHTDDEARAATLAALRLEHARKLAEFERVQAAWATECDRGGCGPIADQLEIQFTNLATEAQTILDRIVSLTELQTGSSELLARMVMTFEKLGLFGTDRQIWLPLFLALSLELGALFGPALLLRQRQR